VVVSVVWLTAPGRARRRVPSGVGGEGGWKAVGEEFLSGVTVGTVGTVGNLSNLGKAPFSVVFPRALVTSSNPIGKGIVFQGLGADVYRGGNCHEF
jgi:hypothetical protein